MHNVLGNSESLIQHIVQVTSSRNKSHWSVNSLALSFSPRRTLIPMIYFLLTTEIFRKEIYLMKNGMSMTCKVIAKFVDGLSY